VSTSDTQSDEQNQDLGHDGVEGIANGFGGCGSKKHLQSARHLQAARLCMQECTPEAVVGGAAVQQLRQR